MSKNRFMPVLTGGLAFTLICGLVWQMLPTANAALSSNSKAEKFITATDAAGSIEESNSVDPSLILLNAAKINVKSEAAKNMRRAVENFSGKRMHLVTFKAAVQPAWYNDLKANGLEIVDYIPSNTYLVYGDAESLQKMQTKANGIDGAIVWDGEYVSSYRIQPEIFEKGENGEVKLNAASKGKYLVQLYKDDAANAATIDLIKGLRKSDFDYNWSVMHYVNIAAELDEAGIKQIAERTDVISIAPYVEPQKNDEAQNVIMTGSLTGNTPTTGINYLSYLAGKGFTQAQFDASGFTVNVSDDGLDSGTANATTGAPNPTTQFLLYKGGNPASTSRVTYVRPYGTATLADSRGCDGHGNLNSTIIGGFVPDGAPFNAAPHVDARGLKYGLGVAPFVKVGNSTIFRIGGSFSSPNLTNLEAEAYRDGSRISSNSWGANVSGAYNANSQTFDSLVRDAQGATSTVPVAGNQEYTVVFSAGNSGAGASTIGAPGTGKNVITVGAAENVQPFSGADGCGVADNGADSANDIIGFSSRGPTTDGRRKPEIQAPGTHITGGVYQAATATAPVSGTGAGNSCFAAGGICGGVGTADYFPAGQQFYSASSGTSHSAPAVAGVAALIRQHFLNQSLSAPSPALTKALLMNSARYMTGVGANDNLFSNSQGMGMVSLNNYFDGIFGGNRIIRDQIAADKFTASGQVRIIGGTVASSTKPVRVTVAWTEPPGSTTAAAFVNDLDLEVLIGGQTYRGNVFTGANSSTGGTADNRNNAESVFIPAGVSGNMLIRLKATAIGGNGVPGDADPLDQDYALIVQNMTESAAAVPIVESTGITYISDNGTPVNNTPDPGETVTVSLGLQNGGTGTSGNVTATLLGTGGIANPSAAQSYGTLAAGATAVTRNFTFQVPAATACGSQITLTFQVNDGTNTFNVTRTYDLGTTFKSGAVTIVDATSGTAPGAANPYPATINVNGISGALTSVKVKINGFSHTFPDDVDLMLVNPAGTAMLVMSDAGGSGDAVGTNLVFDDAAAAQIADAPTTAIPSGTYKPANYIAANDVFPAGPPTTVANPGPGGTPAGTATLNGTFGSGPANGEWKVYIADGFVQDTGSIQSISLVLNNIEFACSTVGPTAPTNSRADFDGDGRTDLSVFRNGNWFLQRSTAGFAGVSWGAAGDTILPGDFNGDNKTDFAIYRQAGAGTATDMFVLTTDTNTVSGIAWGDTGDIPKVGDFNADNRDDLAVYRPSNNTWYILPLGAGAPAPFTASFGVAGSVLPLVMDFDGDSRSDLVNKSGADWYIRRSSDASVQYINWGNASDRAVPADYNNDNKEDVAIFRNGVWFVLPSGGGAPLTFYFGAAGDVPVPGDYDGDGDDDVAIFRNGNWFVSTPAGGFTSTIFGVSGDSPVPTAYIQ